MNNTSRPDGRDTRVTLLNNTFLIQRMILLISACTLLPHILPFKGFGNVLVLHAKYYNVHTPLGRRLKKLIEDVEALLPT